MKDKDMKYYQEAVNEMSSKVELVESREKEYDLLVKGKELEIADRDEQV